MSFCRSSGRTSVCAAALVSLGALAASPLVAQQQTRAAPSRDGATCTIVPGAQLVDLAPGSTLSQALRGRVAGLSVASYNGMAGSGTTVNTRGVRGFAGPVEPLVFVDGTRLTPPSRAGTGGQPAVQVLDLIDPSDVARVEVLRGPAATALYGTDASGGVIHIFTKLGVLKGVSRADPKSACP